jgi:hypothetical protein
VIIVSTKVSSARIARAMTSAPTLAAFRRIRVPSHKRPKRTGPPRGTFEKRGPGRFLSTKLSTTTRSRCRIWLRILPGSPTTLSAGVAACSSPYT